MACCFKSAEHLSTTREKEEGLGVSGEVYFMVVFVFSGEGIVNLDTESIVMKEFA